MGDWNSELNTYTQGKGPKQISTDPSTVLVPVGHNTKGFALCCFATAAVCSLSCLLPFIAPCPSMSDYIEEIQASCPFLPVQVLLYSKVILNRDSTKCCWWAGESKGMWLQCLSEAFWLLISDCLEGEANRSY